MRNGIKTAIAVAATLVIVGPLGYYWHASLIPGTYDVTSMGYDDFGGGDSLQHGTSISVTSLTGPTTGTPDVAVTLTAAQGRNGLFTLNGSTPGPVIRAVQGQLVQVTLVNSDIKGGVTLHWHGVDVPNAEDGVAGVTQDAVMPGKSYVYRFVVQDAGTYWYHSHQDSAEEVAGGLFGTLIVLPKPSAAAGSVSGPSVTGGYGAVADGVAAVDQVAAVHTYQGKPTVNGAPGVTPVAAGPGAIVRARVIDTDPGPLRAWVTGAPFRIVAVDGHDVNQPTAITGKSVLVTAGGRMDLQFTMPPSGAVRVDLGAGAALVVGTGDVTPAAAPVPTVDLLSYGSPAPLGFDPAAADRNFDYRIGHRPGFIDGKPGLWWSVNGHLYPDVPMFMVSTGDIVKMTIANSSGEVHPLHLHGHHAVVLSRNGVAATGSPWWFDSLNVANGDTYVIAFIADNPGIWMDHCHNLKHAEQGLLAHLAYTGITTPYRIGGKAGNNPE